MVLRSESEAAARITPVTGRGPTKRNGYSVLMTNSDTEVGAVPIIPVTGMASIHGP